VKRKGGVTGHKHHHITSHHITPSCINGFHARRNRRSTEQGSPPLTAAMRSRAVRRSTQLVSLWLEPLCRCLRSASHATLLCRGLRGSHQGSSSQGSSSCTGKRWCRYKAVLLYRRIFRYRLTLWPSPSGAPTCPSSQYARGTAPAAAVSAPTACSSSATRRSWSRR
jgi:hypothetical protein